MLINLSDALALSAEPDLQRIEHQIQLTRDQLSQVAAEVRDAKVLAAEKMMAYEAVREQHQQETTSVSINSLDHAQQRLALAEMGVESKVARFERIQKKLGELAEAKQEILAEPPALEQQSLTTETPNSEPDQRPPLQPSSTDAVAESSSPPTTFAPLDESLQMAPLPLVKQILKPETGDEPVLTHHGKLSDIYQLNSELQKLERHLLEQVTTPAGPVQAKMYGTAITGEVPLVSMGGNQFFARFPAPAGEASLIIGARHSDGYVRTTMHITFLPEETGKEFFLIFDFNDRDQPRALVFQESLVFTREMFASHSDF